MKTRILQTRYWDDQFISEANYITRYVYLYLLTSQYINISGIFQLTINKILFETGISKQQFLIAEKDLKENGKALFLNGWVYVANARKNNKYENSPLNVICCENEMSKVPIEILDKIKLYQNSTMDTTIKVLSIVPINNNIINNNNKTNNIKTYTKDNLTLEQIALRLSEHYEKENNRKSKIPPNSYKSLAYWLEVYSPNDIAKAISCIKYDKYWGEDGEGEGGMDLTLLFRKSNNQKEPVDYIGKFLNQTLPVKTPNV